MKYSKLILSALAAFTGAQALAQTARISSVAIAPATGVVTVTERIGTPTNAPTSVSDNLAGLAYAENNVPLTGDLANSPVSVALFAITGRTIAGGAQVDDFKGYGTIIAPNTSVATYIDVRNKFTAQAAFYPPGPNSYSGLIWLPVGDTLSLPGPNVFYTIHHRPSGDYFSVIVPGTSNTSDAYDLKPMSAAGVVTDPSKPGYFGLAYASVAPAAGYNANSMYYLRTAQSVDAYPAGHIVFGEMIPALTSGPADKFDLNTAVGSFGVAGYKALVFSPDNLGDGVSQFYYLRQDSTGTGNTILGRLNPSTTPGVRTISDIANLGGVFDTLALARAATGPAAAWSTSPTLFASGAALATGARSVSFAAISDKVIGAAFSVTPTATFPNGSNGGAITLTVVSGPAVVSGVGPTFTVTTNGPGIVTLRATQAGGGLVPANWLEQSFNVLGPVTTQAIATKVLTAGVLAVPFTPVTSTGGTGVVTLAISPGLPAGLSFNSTTGAITGTPAAVSPVTTYTVTATDSAIPAASSSKTFSLSVVPAGSPLSTTQDIPTKTLTAGTLAVPFTPVSAAGGTAPITFAITGTALPGGLSISGATGTISGTPAAASPATTYTVTATDSAVPAATSSKTFSLTVSAIVPPAVAPVITSSSNAPGTVGTPFSYNIAASGSPTSYAASPLPAGLSIVAATGAITGTPTTVGTTVLSIQATNGVGTGTSTLVITVAPSALAPIITGATTAPGTVGVPFVTYQITATGQPTSYSATGLPAGLTINPLTGAITGTPTSAGIAVANLRATNAFGSDNATLTFTVAPAIVAPIITSATTANGTVGVPFITYVFAATGTPTSYTATGLPPGLTMVNPLTGAIAGTPTTAGISVVALTATNSAGTDTHTLTITIAPVGVAPIITSPTTAPGTVGSPFVTYVIAATGLPTSFGATGLPAGLSVNSLTGAINGTPTTSGVSVVTLSATNSTGTGSATLTITVAPAAVAPIITSPITAPGTVGTPFVTYQITATGLPTSFGATGLPAGLVVNTLTGRITGTPTTAGISVATISATNSTGTGSATLTITVAPAAVAPIITSPTTAPGTVGTPFVTYEITATGLPTSYGATSLPAGLVFNALTGRITGTPTVAGISVAVLSATNSTGTDTHTLTITVASAGVAPIITSPTAAPGTVGTPFVTYQITATGLPTSFGATGLPAGLAVNALTGWITGTPTTAGVSIVSLSATNSTGTDTDTLTITVAPAGVAPIITSPTAAPGTVGTPFVSYTITATGLPTSFSATGLPAGLTINTLTGRIAGTPTTAGNSVVTLNATNSTGTGSATLTITVAAAATAPVITGPATAAGTVGKPIVSYQIVATGLPTSYGATGLPAGLVVNALTGRITGTPTAAGNSTVTIRATNGSGTGTATLTIAVVAAGVIPVITNSPTPLIVTGTVGVPFSYTITASGSPTSYTAFNLPPGLFINPLTGVISGTPTRDATTFATITATNANGSGTIVLMIVTTVAPPVPAPSSRIVNFSARALSGPGDQTLIMGFVVSGDGKNLLVRGIGPTLASFGVLNALADPLLTLSNAGGAVMTNDNWQTTSSGVDQGAIIAATAARVGAFALQSGSKDAALLYTVNSGAHTTGLVRPNSTTGVALTEIYDTDTTGTSRLVNVSARMNVTTGEGTLIAGLAIAGNAPRTLLIRGVGPTLSVFGVAGVLADPTIAVFSGATQVATNDNWETGASTAAQLIATSARVGAFALNAGSKDAALLVTLEPGNYTVQVTGVGNTAGVAIVEVYDTQ